MQETTKSYRMLLLCLCVILSKPTFIAMDDVVGSIVNITGYMGETIRLTCFNGTAGGSYLPRNGEKREVTWNYLFQDNFTENPSYVKVATCEDGSWYNVLSGHQLIGSDDACDNGLAYMSATEPGNFNYKCQEMSGDGRDVIREIIFIISLKINSSISPCLAKYVPPSQNLTFDFICINFHNRGCLTEDANKSELFLQRNGVRIIPNITLANKIVARIKLENISSISQYYCINQNHLSPCVVDDVTLSNPIGITPIVNRVIEGADAIFECIFMDGHERGEKYEWRFSRHIEFSRISGTASSTLKISKVQSKSDGVIVMCAIDVNGASFYSEALLRILSLGGSSTTASYSSEISTSTISTESQDVKTKLESRTTIKPSPPYSMSIIVVAVLFICTLCILALVVAANPKTRRRCRQLTSKDPNVQGAIGLTRLESNARLSRTPTAPSPTPRRPSAAALPLPLTPSPKESSELCPGAMFGGPESSHQHIDHSGAMPSPISLCQSPPSSALLASAPYCYHVYQGLEDEHHPLSTSSFGATSTPKCPIKSKSSSIKTHKSGKSSTTQTLSPYEINRSVSLPSKKTYQHSCTGSPLISLTRKGSANNQPLPPIPKPPGSYDEQDTITESCLSKELPVAVIKPMIHGYASIQDDQHFHCDERLSMPDASGLHSPSATTTTNNAHDGYTGYAYGNENLRKILVDEEIKSSSRSSSLIPDCHTYAVADHDSDENIAGMSAKSIYHTIDEEKRGTLLNAGGQPVQRTDDATSAKRNSVSSNRHIYEMPVDDIAQEVNNQSDSAETTFYFTLDSDNDRNSKDVTIDQTVT